MNMVAIQDSASGWYKKGDKAEFVREFSTYTRPLIVVRKAGEKRTTFVWAANWRWIQ